MKYYISEKMFNQMYDATNHSSNPHVILAYLRRCGDSSIYETFPDEGLLANFRELLADRNVVPASTSLAAPDADINAEFTDEQYEAMGSGSYQPPAPPDKEADEGSKRLLAKLE